MSRILDGSDSTSSAPRYYAPGVREVFEEYIFNDIPARLIDVDTIDDQTGSMKLVNREFIMETFQRDIEQITEAQIGVRWVDREEKILQLVKEIIRYAIFSHRWFSKEEVTYDDIADDDRRTQSVSRQALTKKRGHQKLVQFCCAARAHGCRFVWCDTCCIDKSNPAELDEAIRSMFRWYNFSHVCIVYLADTTSLDDLEDDPWFTRGWTLQELLAPSRIKFYKRNWTPLVPLTTTKNDKVRGSILVDKLSRITKISVEDLLCYRAGTENVKKKMMWASHRQTTRVEDIAYSLIGIFDVTLVIAYGEGRRAFFRLMEAILQRYDRCEVFFWAGRPSLYNPAIPASPRCYDAGELGLHRVLRSSRKASREEADNDRKHPVGDERFALTNHGMRLTLLCVQVALAGKGELREDGLFTHLFKCPRVKSFLKDFTVTCRSRLDRGEHWWIGIIDYWRSSETQGFVDKCRSYPYTAFLLRQNSSTKWRKEPTEELVRVAAIDYYKSTLTAVYL